MRALALEHLHSNPVGVYGDVLLGRGMRSIVFVSTSGKRFPTGASMTCSLSWEGG